MAAKTMRNRGVNRRKTNTVGRWKLYFAMFSVTVVIVAGFFFSGRQQFSLWDYSIRNSRLRKQISELETEKRRLMLAREVALSPNELRKGVRSTNAPAAELAVAKTPNAPLNAVKRIEKVEIRAAEPKPVYLIVKTAMTTAVSRPAKQQKNSALDQAE